MNCDLSKIHLRYILIHLKDVSIHILIYPFIEDMATFYLFFSSQEVAYQHSSTVYINGYKSTRPFSLTHMQVNAMP